MSETPKEDAIAKGFFWSLIIVAISIAIWIGAWAFRVVTDRNVEFNPPQKQEIEKK